MKAAIDRVVVVGPWRRAISLMIHVSVRPAMDTPVIAPST
jgi:hypothetical protein